MKANVAHPPQSSGALSADAVMQISNALRQLLADVFTLYVKTKNYHWHMTGRHFRDYHLLLDEQAEQLFSITDEIAERARKLGGSTIRSIGDISRHQRIGDSDEEHLSPEKMLAQLRDDSVQLTGYLRDAHHVCEEHGDVATTSLIEVWIDQAERRSWFLREVVDRP
jgi:starvation-inducible DNA-binding protein